MGIFFFYIGGIGAYEQAEFAENLKFPFECRFSWACEE